MGHFGTSKSTDQVQVCFWAPQGVHAIDRNRMASRFGWFMALSCFSLFVPILWSATTLFNFVGPRCSLHASSLWNCTKPGPLVRWSGYQQGSHGSPAFSRVTALSAGPILRWSHPEFAGRVVCLFFIIDFETCVVDIWLLYCLICHDMCPPLFCLFV